VRGWMMLGFRGDGQGDEVYIVCGERIFRRGRKEISVIAGASCIRIGPVELRKVVYTLYTYTDGEAISYEW
jgi:hypothetical protein